MTKRADHWVKTLRVKANLTQVQLSVLIKVSPAALRKWEHGEIEPSMSWDQWQKFSEIIGVPFEQLPIYGDRTA